MSKAKESRFIVGIDLGTTHTVVAYVDTHRGPGAPIEELAIEQLVAPGEIEARPLLHSLRYHPAGGELTDDDRQLPWHPRGLAGVPEGVVGELARQLGAKVPGRLVASAKSWLSHPNVDRTAAILPWGAPEDVPKVSPVGASASYLAHVRDAWDHCFEDEPLDSQQVVLTVPASFDEGARALTVRAAREAGLGAVRLLEEPQAAFYDWLGRHDADIEALVAKMHLALVVDVGGGTTDLTLIQVELRESGPRLTRVAVGDHLMLGGDNMDLALAHDAEARLGSAEKLGAGRFTQLLQQCRLAKERLLERDAPDAVKVTVLGGGRKLIGGSLSTELERAAVHERIVEGFFPAVGPDARPERKRGAIVEFGLPYVADPAITRHVAAFLERHSDVAREAFPTGSIPDGALAVPDAVLLNGGVFKGHALSARMMDVLGAWRGGEPPMALENPAPELAVARGAVAYGLARRGVGVRIGGGSARSYYLALDGGERGVCLLPRGAEEGEEVVLKTRSFALKLGEPVRFELVSSTGEAVLHRPGDLVELGPSFRALPPLAAVLEDESGASGKTLPVRLSTALTEVGTVELECVAAEGAARRWKLELLLRGEASEGVAAKKVTQLHPRFEEATARIRDVFGKSSANVEGAKPVKTLRAGLEKTIGARQSWNTPLLRELFGALLAGLKRRRRSADHERVWLNLTGYCLRPGYGYPLDDWRVKQLFAIFDQGVQFAPEAQVWSEWWTMWRRVAGGLDAEAQVRVLDTLAWYLHPPTKRPRARPKGPKMLGYDDMVRLAGSLERVPAARKTEVGGWLATRLARHDEGDFSYWALGRIGARVPFYGSAHEVVPRDVAAGWLEQVLAADWRESENAAFAATVLARMSGDRERDLDDALRAQVAARLEAISAPASWVAMVREVTQLEEADERRLFGESLPPGLVLLD
ncbi:MAG: hsp70 family protein [Sandaracinaceae bacterium]|nr:hsp70 family protein [Sandaracinaceae bacterium]